MYTNRHRTRLGPRNMPGNLDPCTRRWGHTNPTHIKTSLHLGAPFQVNAAIWVSAPGCKRFRQERAVKAHEDHVQQILQAAGGVVSNLRPLGQLTRRDLRMRQAKTLITNATAAHQAQSDRSLLAIVILWEHYCQALSHMHS